MAFLKGHNMGNGIDVKGWVAIIITVVWGAAISITSAANTFRAQEIADVKSAVSIHSKEIQSLQLDLKEIKTIQKYQNEGIEKIIKILEKGGSYVTAE